MTEKTDIQIATEKAAEVFDMNLRRGCEAISYKRPLHEPPKYQEIKIADMDMDYLMNENVNGLNIITTDIMKQAEVMAGEFDKLCIEACYKVNVDPDVLIKQANLIADLRKALDVCGVPIIGTPFTEYYDLIEENKRLRNIIQELMEGEWRE